MKLNLGRFFAFILFVSSLPALAKVTYHLDVNDPEHHLAEVTATFTAPKQAKTLTLQLPAWRSGRYEILDLANGIRDFEVTDRQNKSLSWQKVDKSSWQIQLNGRKKITVKYQVYANQLSYRSRHIDETHAFIDASGFFLYSQALRHQPVDVSLTIPKHWDSISGMESGGGKHRFVAPNYDILVDSPIEAGVFERYAFKSAGVDFELAIWGEGNYDGQQMADDLAKMVTTANSIWQGTPFKRYVFMVHATTNVRGATEHINSTIIQRKRFTFAPRDQYLEFLATAAHEYVHTWNVKTYRPQGLTPYDYQNENYTQLLWIAEGSTSYLEYQLLLRAGLITAEEYFEELAREIFEHDHTPGRLQQAIAEASFDKWIGERGDRAHNSQVNIYDEGALLSLLLDLQIIEQSRAKKSYRDIHNALYQDHPLPKGYTVDDVKQILKDVTGKDYNKWWNNYIDRAKALEFDDALASVGLKIEAEATGYDLGIMYVMQGDMTVIKQVVKDSAAWQAGLTPEDVILTIDGLRLYPNTLEARVNHASKQDSIELALFRRDAIITKTVNMVEEKPTRYRIVKVRKPTARQKANYKKWIGLDF
ncbi:M61 family metallopeptidase [Catenovulum sp. SM1970]|uniref:M61 family metallopeptidase n=1 Tax=Marinifaba aquimaris TaxID=2741323 RepID=UPI001571681D|nr:PDZ domain-containing protein [Marinifaba aquimaris]NTS77670.1 M61 family metallopeptidase [Marinifaba aquimaris]